MDVFKSITTGLIETMRRRYRARVGVGLVEFIEMMAGLFHLWATNSSKPAATSAEVG